MQPLVMPVAEDLGTPNVLNVMERDHPRADGVNVLPYTGEMGFLNLAPGAGKKQRKKLTPQQKAKNKRVRKMNTMLKKITKRKTNVVMSESE